MIAFIQTLLIVIPCIGAILLILSSAFYFNPDRQTSNKEENRPWKRERKYKKFVWSARAKRAHKETFYMEARKK